MSDRGATSGDAELVQQALAGDARALRAIWDRYAPLARRVVGRSLGPAHEFEDVVQDVFLGLFKNLPTLRDHSALRSFVIAICVRCVHSEIRRKRFRRLFSLSPTPDLSEERRTASADDSWPVLLSLYHLLDRLPCRERTAFALRHLDGMELEEIAAALEVSTPTVRRTLARASERLTRWSRDDEVLTLYLPVRK